MDERDLGLLEVLIVLVFPIAVGLAIIGIGSWEFVKRLRKRLKRVQTK